MKEVGWEIYTIHHSRWSKDIFGLFDGFVIKDGILIFFQVKTNKKPRLDKYTRWVSKYGIPVILATYIDRKGWRIGILKPKPLYIT